MALERVEVTSPPSGTVYVLRSQSMLPFIAEHRSIIHKIGVTSGSITSRIAKARQDPTFLMAPVTVIATYNLFGIDRFRLERIIHRVFGAAQLDVQLQDRLGLPIKPKEWFLVPLAAIDEAIKRIEDGSIVRYVYDPAVAQLVLAAGNPTSPSR